MTQPPPDADPYGDRAAAAAAVSGPAIMLMIAAGLGLALQLPVLALSLVNVVRGKSVVPNLPPDVPPEIIELVEKVLGAAGIGFAAFFMILAVVVLVGAVKMKRLESYGFAMTGAIIALLPCRPAASTSSWACPRASGRS